MLMKHESISATDTVFMASWQQKIVLILLKLSLLYSQDCQTISGFLIQLGPIIN